MNRNKLKLEKTLTYLENPGKLDECTREAYEVHLDGKPILGAQEASAGEGWVNVFSRKDKLVHKVYGKVEIKLKDQSVPINGWSQTPVEIV